jgi:hypothetical protein
LGPGGSDRVSRTTRNVAKSYTGDDASTQLALRALEDIAELQHSSIGHTPARDARAVTLPRSGTEAPAPGRSLAPAPSPSPHRPDRGHARSSRWQRLPLLGRISLPLAAVLGIQAGLSLRLVWSNTAFADEALYLWAGHIEWAHWLKGAPIASEALPTYFSGAPVIYPPLGALADSLGGLAAARLLSLAFMLGATLLLYATTRRLFDARSSMFAVALFAGTGATQFLGAFATYDAMALFLLTLATWGAVRASDCRLVPPVMLLAMSAGAMALADAAKYAATLFDPVVLAVAALALWRTGGARRAIAGTATLLGVAAALAGAGLWVAGRQYWTGITSTTLTRGSGTASVLAVLFDSGKWVGAVALLAVCGAIVTLWSGKWRTRLLGCVLASAVFLAPAEQARIHTMTSLFKHVGYGAWFGSIIAGYALASLARAVPVVKVRAAYLVSSTGVVLAGIVGLTFAGAHFAGWPNTTVMMKQIAPLLTRDGCPCLATQNNAIDYYLRDLTYSGQLRNAFAFYYWDQHTHRELSGVPAYQAAIAAHYFRVVEIDPSLNPAVYPPIVHALTGTSGYRLAGTSPSGSAGQPIQVWVLNGNAG